MLDLDYPIGWQGAIFRGRAEGDRTSNYTLFSTVFNSSRTRFTRKLSISKIYYLLIILNVHYTRLIAPNPPADGIASRTNEASRGRSKNVLVIRATATEQLPWIRE